MQCRSCPKVDFAWCCEWTFSPFPQQVEDYGDFRCRAWSNWLYRSCRFITSLKSLSPSLKSLSPSLEISFSFSWNLLLLLTNRLLDADLLLTLTASLLTSSVMLIWSKKWTSKERRLPRSLVLPTLERPSPYCWEVPIDLYVHSFIHSFIHSLLYLIHSFIGTRWIRSFSSRRSLCCPLPCQKEFPSRGWRCSRSRGLLSVPAMDSNLDRSWSIYRSCFRRSPRSHSLHPRRKRRSSSYQHRDRVETTTRSWREVRWNQCEEGMHFQHVWRRSYSAFVGQQQCDQSSYRICSYDVEDWRHGCYYEIKWFNC